MKRSVPPIIRRVADSANAAAEQQIRTLTSKLESAIAEHARAGEEWLRQQAAKDLQWAREREQLSATAARLGKELEETRAALAAANVRILFSPHCLPPQVLLRCGHIALLLYPW